MLVETKFIGTNICQVLFVDLDDFFSWGVLFETTFISTNMLVYLLLGWVLTILALS